MSWSRRLGYLGRSSELHSSPGDPSRVSSDSSWHSSGQSELGALSSLSQHSWFRLPFPEQNLAFFWVQVPLLGRFPPGEGTHVQAGGGTCGRAALAWGALLGTCLSFTAHGTYTAVGPAGAGPWVPDHSPLPQPGTQGPVALGKGVWGREQLQSTPAPSREQRVRDAQL